MKFEKTVDSTEPINQLKQQFGKLKATKFFRISVIGLSALAFGCLIYWFSDAPTSLRASLHNDEAIELGAFPVKTPTLKYGFALDTFQVQEGTIHSGQFLADLLLAQHVDYPSIEKIVQNSKGVFRLNELRPGNAYTILTKDSTGRAEHLIYEPNIYEYVVFNLNENDLSVNRVQRETSTAVKTAAGKIESSLWQAMTDAGMGFDLADKMEDALQWSVDFPHAQKGDEFKLVYDQNYVEGKDAGAGRVHLAYYKRSDNEFYAIYYENGKYKGYYDLEGHPMRSAFLKAPVRASRISSYYNLNRFHPILRRVRPHFGTDYAAPAGTPIMSVGDGVVEMASYTSGNGNYVKIRHNGTYESQYLHMRGFAKGIRPGAHVSQGQVIGYVGSTGLATGPHVCFRFWMNGKQVNHLKLNLPDPDPLPASEMDQFKAIRDEYVAKLQTAKSISVEENQSNP